MTALCRYLCALIITAAYAVFVSLAHVSDLGSWALFSVLAVVLTAWIVSSLTKP